MGRMKHLLTYLDEERGRRNKLAERLGISPSAISMWRRIPAERVLDIEVFTGIPKEALRPDLYLSKAKPLSVADERKAMRKDAAAMWLERAEKAAAKRKGKRK